MTRDRLFDLPNCDENYLSSKFKLFKVAIRKALGQYDSKGWEDEFR